MESKFFYFYLFILFLSDLFLVGAWCAQKGGGGGRGDPLIYL